MEKIKFKKSDNGYCYTSCPYHNNVMVGSVKCEGCIYCKELILEHGNTYALCRFKEFADEKKDTQTNSFGNRLKAMNVITKEVGYIDGYVNAPVAGYENDYGAIYAIMYYPQKNYITATRIKDLQIINEGE